LKANKGVLGSVLLLGLLGSLGCSSDTSSGSPAAAGTSGNSDDDVLQVCSWWTAPGAVDALTALVDTYKSAHEGARVYHYSDVTASTIKNVLEQNIVEPKFDVFQLSAVDLPWLLDNHPGAVAELDGIYADAGLDEVMIPEIKNQIMGDGHPYGVVTGVHRNNSFIYNKQIFDAQHLDPPTTVTEFVEVAAALKAAGIMPVASSMDTWVLRVVFEELLAGTMGAQRFDDFVKGKITGSDADVQDDLQVTIDIFHTVVTEYIDVERASSADYHWPNSAQDLYDGKAAMLFHGDWAKGYLLHLGWTAGVDFGVSGPPGASDLFIYGADMLGLPASAPHPQLAHDFLMVAASPEGQVAFNELKGSTPMRTDLADLLDDTAKATLDDLVNAKVLMASHPSAAWDAGIQAFAKDHDNEALLKVYADTSR
jgi:glucose/mannose transport system substrate-binding protein